MDLIIPASGFAMRMNKIPKFLLPGRVDGISLLEIHISLAEGFYDNILVGTRHELVPLLDEKKLGSSVQIVGLETSTMTETVLGLMGASSSDTFSLVMPDTYFLGENPHHFLSRCTSPLNLAAWEIRNTQRGKLGQILIQNTTAIASVDKDPMCEYPHSWGALSFNFEFAKLLNSKMPHIGYAIPDSIAAGQHNSCSIIEGEYFDCGTPSEYFELISRISL